MGLFWAIMMYNFLRLLLLSRIHWHSEGICQSKLHPFNGGLQGHISASYGVLFDSEVEEATHQPCPSHSHGYTNKSHIWLESYDSSHTDVQ
jgi:hypothetical protein